MNEPICDPWEEMLSGDSVNGENCNATTTTVVVLDGDLPETGGDTLGFGLIGFVILIIGVGLAAIATRRGMRRERYYMQPEVIYPYIRPKDRKHQ